MIALMMQSVTTPETSLNFDEAIRHIPEEVIFILVALRTLNLSHNNKCPNYTYEFVLCIREVPGSNFDPVTGYADRGFPCFFGPSM
jgi:hypothetical protein